MKIGNILLDKPLALAPMEDVSDPPFRKICKEFGADLMYTEFTNCEALIRNVPRSVKKIQIVDEERPIGIQIYGSAEESMQKAAAMSEEAGPDFIDINCGCWVKKVVRRGDGAGLLRDLKKFESVVKSVVSATKLPVTVKTRLGWDDDSIVILDLVRMLEQCGVAALALHCRTRCQGYKGDADWSWLEKVKAASAIPLIGNGDVASPEDVKAMFETGCDGVMIGRGSITSPWLFKHAKHYLATGELLPEPNLRKRVGLCLRHLKGCAAYKGERRAVLEHRKHYSGYLKNVRNVAKFRASLMEFIEIEPIEEQLWKFVDQNT